MDELIPGSLKKDVICLLVLDDFNLKDDDGVQGIILTGSGELVEIRARSAVSSLKLVETTITVPCELATCYAHLKSRRYYLARIGTVVYVVEKGQRLRLYKRIECVHDVKIADLNGTGIPGVVLKVGFDEEPTVLDLNGIGLEPQPLPTVEKNILVPNIGSVNFEIRKVDWFLRKRVTFSRKVTNIINQKCFPKSQCIEVGIPWTKFLKNYCIIGVNVRNRFDKELTQLEINLTFPPVVCKATLILQNQQKGKEEDFIISNTLPKEFSGFVVGIINDFMPVGTEVCFSGIMSYIFSEESVVHCKKLNFKAIDFTIQDSSISEQDNDLLMGLIASAEKKIVNLKCSEEFNPEQVFIQMGFHKFCDNYFLYPIWSHNIMSGLLIKMLVLTESSHRTVTLFIYGRDSKQLHLYLCVFFDVLKSEKVFDICLTPKNLDKSVCIHLCDEIKYLNKLLSHKNCQEFDKDDCLKLLQCEKNSDVNFNDSCLQRYSFLQYIRL